MALKMFIDERAILNPGTRLAFEPEHPHRAFSGRVLVVAASKADAVALAAAVTGYPEHVKLTRDPAPLWRDVFALGLATLDTPGVLVVAETNRAVMALRDGDMVKVADLVWRMAGGIDVVPLNS